MRDHDHDGCLVDQDDEHVNIDQKRNLDLVVKSTLYSITSVAEPMLSQFGCNDILMTRARAGARKTN